MSGHMAQSELLSAMEQMIQRSMAQEMRNFQGTLQCMDGKVTTLGSQLSAVAIEQERLGREQSTLKAPPGPPSSLTSPSSTNQNAHMQGALAADGHDWSAFTHTSLPLDLLVADSTAASALDFGSVGGPRLFDHCPLLATLTLSAPHASNAFSAPSRAGSHDTLVGNSWSKRSQRSWTYWAARLVGWAGVS